MFSRLKPLINKLYTIALMVFTVWFGIWISPLVFGHVEHDPEVVQEPTSSADMKKLEMLGAETKEGKALLKIMKEQKATATTDLGYRVIKEPYLKGHFHHIGPSSTVEADEKNACVLCHGTVPHSKSKTIRAFLNMHAFFVACETCHIKPKPDQKPWAFTWYDKKSGKVVANPPGLVTTDKENYGNYGALISPGSLASDGVFHFLNGEDEREFATVYVKNKDALTPTEKSKMQKVIHKMVNEEPVFCDGCHTSKTPSYLPLAELGYPPRRVDKLTNEEVVGMIEKYKEFYIPTIFDNAVNSEGAKKSAAEKSADKQSGKEAALEGELKRDPRAWWKETFEPKPKSEGSEANAR